MKPEDVAILVYSTNGKISRRIYRDIRMYFFLGFWSWCGELARPAMFLYMAPQQDVVAVNISSASSVNNTGTGSKKCNEKNFDIRHEGRLEPTRCANVPVNTSLPLS